MSSSTADREHHKKEAKLKPKNFVPKGAASFEVDYLGPPKDIYFLLLPKMTMLAFSAAVEPLRIANQVTNRELFRWFLLSEDGKPVECSNGIAVVPDLGLENLKRSSQIFVCSGIEPADSTSPKILAWINRQRAHGCFFGGICSGAFTLAKAGLLTGRTFTLHWENQPSFVEVFDGLEPTANLYEIDKELMTCGGGSAATDMMLNMIEQEHGRELAVVVSDMCIHFRSDTQNSGQKFAYSSALSGRNQHLVSILHLMNKNMEDPMEIPEIAHQIGISRRQLERLFHKYVGKSPFQYYIELRVARAHALINETDMSVSQIAAATGFSGSTQLSIRFKKRFGKSPSAFRKSWSVVNSG